MIGSFYTLYFRLIAQSHYCCSGVHNEKLVFVMDNAHCNKLKISHSACSVEWLVKMAAFTFSLFSFNYFFQITSRDRHQLTHVPNRDTKWRCANCQGMFTTETSLDYHINHKVCVKNRKMTIQWLCNTRRSTCFKHSLKIDPKIDAKTAQILSSHSK